MKITTTKTIKKEKKSNHTNKKYVRVSTIEFLKRLLKTYLT